MVVPAGAQNLQMWVAAPRVARLRNRLAEQRLDGFLVPRADEHQGEYVPKAAERLAWLTGFSGSAGTAAITREASAPTRNPVLRSWLVVPASAADTAITAAIEMAATR